MSLWTKVSAKYHNHTYTCHSNLLKRFVIDFLPVLHNVLFQNSRENESAVDTKLSPIQPIKMSNANMSMHSGLISRVVYNFPRLCIISRACVSLHAGTTTTDRGQWRTHRYTTYVRFLVHKDF